jgi:hypothetical protein
MWAPLQRAGICTGPRRLERGTIVALLADDGWKYLREDLRSRDLGPLEADLEGKPLW